MAHNSNCAHAGTPVCRCAGCGGSEHGWQPYLAAARDASEREELSDRAELAWADATRTGTRPGPTLRKARAAVKGACAGFSGWMASERAAAERAPDPDPDPLPVAVDEIAEAVGRLLGEVAATLDANHEQRVALADHFFCGLLAELAHSIQVLDDALDAAIEKIVEAVVNQRAAENRSPLSRLLIRLAVKATVIGLKQLIARLPASGHISDLQRAFQILAVLMCPAPEHHQAVIEYCIDPLEKPIVTEVIRQRLEASMPKWMTPGLAG
jgi:hypothetical protein